MKTVNVTLPAKQKDQAYSINIGKGLIARIGELFPLADYTRVAVITDSNVAEYWLAPLKWALGDGAVHVVLESGEKAKNIENIQRCWELFANNRFDRKSLVINLGGGVVCDTGAFAASCYMRGIDFLQIPTTLLAQLDASIGGKTGINFSNTKNVIGSFRQPVGVIVDTETLASLPEREYRAGFAEAIKHGAIADANHLEQVEQAVETPRNSPELEAVIQRSCEIKRDIVQSDERESGPRKVLNFGHTVGHAIEALLLGSEGELLHGEAVTIGMCAEAKLSELCGQLPAAELQRLYSLITKCGLPTTLPAKLSFERFPELIALDKKNAGGVVNWTLLEGLGRACYDQHVDEQVVEAAMRTVLDE